jgi:hypothetical protein
MAFRAPGSRRSIRPRALVGGRSRFRGHGRAVLSSADPAQEHDAPSEGLKTPPAESRPLPPGPVSRP